MKNFDKTYRECEAWCIPKLIQVTGSVPTARDYFQDAIVRTWMELEAGKVINGHVPAYVFTISKNLYIDECRKTKPDFKLIDNSKFEELPEAQRFYEQQINPMIMKENEEEKSREDEIKERLLKLALKRMGKKCRELLTRTIVHKERLKDLLDEFGYKSVDVAKSSKYRCRKKLNEHIAAIKKKRKF